MLNVNQKLDYARCVIFDEICWFVFRKELFELIFGFQIRYVLSKKH